MHVADYLVREAQKYFPDTVVHLRVVQETIIFTTDKDEWTCVIGSDDDWYRFTSPHGSVITVPLMPPPSKWNDLTYEQQKFIIDAMVDDILSDPEDYAHRYAEDLDDQGIEDYMEHMREDGDQD